MNYKNKINKKTENNDAVKYEWESQKEYNYRQKTQKVVQTVKAMLNQITKATKENKPLTSNNDFLKIIELLELIKIPEIYKDTNDFLIKSIKGYSKGFELLKESKNTNRDKIILSGVYIREGNCYMELSKLTIYKAVSKKQNKE